MLAKTTKFDPRLKHIPAEIILQLTQIDEMKGRWITGAQLSSQVLGRLKRSVLITSTGASTRIEGAALTDEDIERLMHGIDIQKFTNRDKQEVKGYYELLKNVFDSWKKLSFRESTIKHFHHELLKYVEKDETHRGEYKKKENKVHMVNETGQSVAVLFDTTDPWLTPKEMQELVEWTQNALEEKKHHPLLIIGNFLVQFLAIHPFEDGNGRLSRVLTNLLLLKGGYLYMPYISHEKLIEDNKPEYYIALRRTQKTLDAKKDDISRWLTFFFSVLLKQAEMAVELLSKEKVEKLLTTKQMAVWEYLKKFSTASPGEIAKNTKVAQPTVRQALDKLMRLRKVERIGQGRSTTYQRISA
jgi:Fic family protein